MTARRLICLMGPLFLAAGAAQAQTCSATVAGGGITFNNVDPIALSAVTAQSTLSVTCNWGLLAAPTVRLCVNLGLGNSSTSVNPRRMQQGTANALQYLVRTGSAAGLVLGSTETNNQPLNVQMTWPGGGVNTLTQTFTLYGEILANQPAVPVTNAATTVYTETFSSASARLTYQGYALPVLDPGTCPVLLASSSPIGFTATANVTKNCTISAAPMAFPQGSTLGTALNATSSLTLRCSNTLPYAIALSGGGSNAVTARRMSRTANGVTTTVDYQLYLDAARSQIWGDGTGGTLRHTANGTGYPAQVTVYGQVPAQATPVPGDYSDTITATILF